MAEKQDWLIHDWDDPDPTDKDPDAWQRIPIKEGQSGTGMSTLAEMIYHVPPPPAQEPVAPPPVAETVERQLLELNKKFEQQKLQKENEEEFRAFAARYESQQRFQLYRHLPIPHHPPDVQLQAAPVVPPPVQKGRSVLTQMISRAYEAKDVSILDDPYPAPVAPPPKKDDVDEDDDEMPGLEPDSAVENDDTVSPIAPAPVEKQKEREKKDYVVDAFILSQLFEGPSCPGASTIGTEVFRLYDPADVQVLNEPIMLSGPPLPVAPQPSNKSTRRELRTTIFGEEDARELQALFAVFPVVPDPQDT